MRGGIPQNNTALRLSKNHANRIAFGNAYIEPPNAFFAKESCITESTIVFCMEHRTVHTYSFIYYTMAWFSPHCLKGKQARLDFEEDKSVNG